MLNVSYTTYLRILLRLYMYGYGYLIGDRLWIKMYDRDTDKDKIFLF